MSAHYTHGKGHRSAEEHGTALSPVWEWDRCAGWGDLGLGVLGEARGFQLSALECSIQAPQATSSHSWRRATSLLGMPRPPWARARLDQSPSAFCGLVQLCISALPWASLWEDPSLGPRLGCWSAARHLGTFSFGLWVETPLLGLEGAVPRFGRIGGSLRECLARPLDPPSMETVQTPHSPRTSFSWMSLSLFRDSTKLSMAPQGPGPGSSLLRVWDSPSASTSPLLLACGGGRRERVTLAQEGPGGCRVQSGATAQRGGERLSPWVWEQNHRHGGAESRPLGHPMPPPLGHVHAGGELGGGQQGWGIFSQSQFPNPVLPAEQVPKGAGSCLVLVS